MSIKDFFTSEAKKREAEEKARKEQQKKEELILYKGKRKLENDIAAYKKDKVTLSKQCDLLEKKGLKSSQDYNIYINKFISLNSKLAETEKALDKIKDVESKLMNGTNIGSESITNDVAEILRAIDILTTPTNTGHMSETDMIQVEKNLAEKLGKAPAAGIDLDRLIISEDDSNKMSPEEAYAAMKETLEVNNIKNSPTKDNTAKINAELYKIDSDIDKLKSEVNE